MKKITAILLGTLIASSAELAQANQVLSRNAVGYVRPTVTMGTTTRLHLLRNDFVPLSGGYAITNILGNQVPNGTQILLWNPSSQTYRPAIGKNQFGWGAAGTNTLPNGVAFFLRTPTNSVTTNVSIFFMGEVPDQVTSPSNNSSVVAGLNLVGFPYPVDVSWTNTALAKALPIGSQILTWNTTNQSYNPAIGKNQFGWGASGNALRLQPGQGYFVRGSTNIVGSLNYSEVKPYTWP